MIHLLLDCFASASQVNEQQNRESKDEGTTAERGWGEQKREGVNELAGRRGKEAEGETDPGVSKL